MAIVIPLFGDDTDYQFTPITNPLRGGDECFSYIGYINALYGATYSDVSEGDARDCGDWRMYTQWRGGASASFVATFDSVRTIDYVAGYRYDFRGSDLVIEYWDETTWQPLTTISPVLYADGRPFMKVFQPVETTKVRVSLPDADVDARLAVLAIGEVLAIRQQQVGFAPSSLGRLTEYKTNVSITGHVAGRSAWMNGSTFEITAKLMEPTFALTGWQRFIQHAEILPFFFSYKAAEWGETSFVAATLPIPKGDYSSCRHIDHRIPVEGVIYGRPGDRSV